MGVMVALVSFVQASGNNIRSVTADGYRVVFSPQGPLVLVCVSRTGQPDSQLLSELRYVYEQILTMLTASGLSAIFRRKQNYDLRRLLSGSEKILDNLCDRVDLDPQFLLSSVRCLPLPPSLRDAVGHILQRCSTPDLVFSILLAGRQLVNVVQERSVLDEGRLRPSDLHLLFNLVSGTSSSPSAEVWTPVCLPGFCGDSYFYAYVSYLDPDLSLCLLLLSTDRLAFYSVAECRRRIEASLRSLGLLEALAESLPSSPLPPLPPPPPLSLCPELWHFLFKPLDIPEPHHRQLPQYSSPDDLTPPYTLPDERRRLADVYRYLHGRLHNSARPLRLLYHVGDRETLLAWVTSKFELYTCLSPVVTKAVAVASVTKLLRWLKKEESHLFIRHPLKYSPTPPTAHPHTDTHTDNSHLSLL